LGVVDWMSDPRMEPIVRTSERRRGARAGDVASLVCAVDEGAGGLNKVGFGSLKEEYDDCERAMMDETRLLRMRHSCLAGERSIDDILVA
jgi:hypothetical protein